MMASAIRIERPRAEELRQRLRAAGALRTDLSIDVVEGIVYLPVHGPGPTGHPTVEHLFRPRRGPAPREYRDRVDVPPELKPRLPRSFDVIGDLVLIRIPAELAPHARAIGEALLAFVPGARRVGRDRGVVGPARIRSIEPIAGTGPFRTVHHENGIALTVDLDRAYFSPRLAREHARVAAAVGAGERILDLCCGIGPFALTALARAPSCEITAVDLNPAAIELLRESAMGSVGRLTMLVEEAGAFLDRSGSFDRIILNLPHGGARLLPLLAPHLAPGGTLHYYEVVHRADRARRGAEISRAGGPVPPWSIDEMHVVHEYSPGEDLLGYTIKRASGP